MKKETKKQINGYMLLVVLVLSGIAIYLSNKAIEKTRIVDSEAKCGKAALLKEDPSAGQILIGTPETMNGSKGGIGGMKAIPSCSSIKFNKNTLATTGLKVGAGVSNSKNTGYGYQYTGEGAAICGWGRNMKLPTEIRAICLKGYVLGDCETGNEKVKKCACVVKEDENTTTGI